MKLLTRDQNQFVFLIGKRERAMMLDLLKNYPVVHSSYHKLSRNSDAAELGADVKLLEEALAEHRRENQAAVQAMINEPGRFVEDELGFRFSLKRSEMEWLLQILNDVRVGSWIKLGSPNPREPSNVKLTEETVKLAWSMEVAGLFQGALLFALNSSDTGV